MRERIPDSPFSNHIGIFNPESYDHYAISIVGCGSVGSFTALTLAKMGFKTLFLYDKDKVERHNIPVQFFNINSIGLEKTRVLSDMIQQYSDCRATDMKIKYKRLLPFISPIVISSTDNMGSRKQIYKGCLKSKVKLLIDARMGGEVFSIFTVDLTNPEARAKYEKTFHKTINLRCTEKGIIYNCLMISSTIASQLVKVLQNQSYSFCVDGSSRTLEFYHSK